MVTNAKIELLAHLKETDKDIEYIYIKYYNHKYRSNLVFKGKLSQVINELNFNYDSSFGAQELFGYVWFTDGTWSERGEYDGSEWWKHIERPEIPKD